MNSIEQAELVFPFCRHTLESLVSGSMATASIVAERREEALHHLIKDKTDGLGQNVQGNGEKSSEQQ